jgi:hypothetical protein
VGLLKTIRQAYGRQPRSLQPLNISACERRKAAEAAAKMFNGHSFDGGGPGHDIEHIDRIVREGAPRVPTATTPFTWWLATLSVVA